MKRLVMADSRGSVCSPKAGFGGIRLLARRAACGLGCELTQPAKSGPLTILPIAAAQLHGEIVFRSTRVQNGRDDACPDKQLNRH